MKNKYLYTNKKEFAKYFKREILPEVKEIERENYIDKPLRAETWNNLLDSLYKDNQVPEYALDWVCPFLDKERKSC